MWFANRRAMRQASKTLKAAREEIISLRNVLAEVIKQRDKQAADISQIRAALSEVAVYEGLVGVSPVAMMVADLVRDHEELEARIDAILMLLIGAKEAAEGEPTPLIDEVARLLRGGERIDPIETLSLDD